MSLIILNIQNRKNHTNLKQTSDYQGLEGEGTETANGFLGG